jgi:hypothetical protein
MARTELPRAPEKKQEKRVRGEGMRGREEETCEMMRREGACPLSGNPSLLSPLASPLPHDRNLLLSSASLRPSLSTVISSLSCCLGVLFSVGFIFPSICPLTYRIKIKY